MLTAVIAFLAGVAGGFIFGLLFGRKNKAIADKVNDIGKDAINKVK
jgi:hypothetical protein